MSTTAIPFSDTETQIILEAAWRYMEDPDLFDLLDLDTDAPGYTTLITWAKLGEHLGKDDDDEPNDEILAQQEMEDFAQDGELENMSAADMI